MWMRHVEIKLKNVQPYCKNEANFPYVNSKIHIGYDWIAQQFHRTRLHRHTA